MELLNASKIGYLEKVRHLIESKCDIQHMNYNGDNALIFASYNGHINVVKYLIDSGSDIHLVNCFGDNALMWASYEGHIDVVKYLIDLESDIHHENNSGCNAFILALRIGHINVVNYINKIINFKQKFKQVTLVDPTKNYEVYNNKLFELLLIYNSKQNVILKEIILFKIIPYLFM